jgi:lipoprotein-anchoring transpeptidase ErfK/SrfK
LQVRAVAENPTYRYNPDFKFKGQKATEPVTIAAGPNNPVGAVWIALSEATYGIHGTAHPETVGKAESHGCVRLTNWDALALAKMVKKGTRVEFIE